MDRIPCRCVHSHNRLAHAVDLERSRLYAGLYDGSTVTAESSDSASVRLRLLNPGFAGTDATSRRFALLEMD